MNLNGFVRIDNRYFRISDIVFFRPYVSAHSVVIKDGSMMRKVDKEECYGAIVVKEFGEVKNLNRVESEAIKNAINAQEDAV